MKTVNDHALKFACLVGRVPPRPLTATFVVKAAFKLQPGGIAELLPEDQQPEFGGDQFQGDDPAQGLRYASDFALFKPGADLLLAGHCHAPMGESVKRTNVVFGVGDTAKRLLVFGDRFWIRGPLGASMSEPQAFVRMPLNWTRSFGGQSDPRNPAGRGIAEITLANGTNATPLPNTESAHSLISSPHDRPVPVGFGPLEPTSPLRASKTGTYNAQWLEQRWPWLPDDFDWTFFNAAPPDQQLQGRFLRGDEPLRFDNMHPDVASYECRLSAERVRLFVNRRKGPSLVFEEVPLRLDTLFADMDAETVTLVWRGLAAADSMKLKEFEEAFVLMEPLGRPRAADLAGYQQLYTERQAEIVKAETMELKPIDPIVVVPPRLPNTAWADRLKATVAALPPIVPDDPDHPIEAEWRKAFGIARPVGKAPTAPVVGSLADGDALIKAELAKLQEAEPGIAKVFSNVPPDFAAFEKELAEDEKNMTPGAGDDIGDDPEEDDEWSRERVERQIAAGGTFDGEDLSGLDLSHLDFSGLSFRETVLDDTRLIACTFDGADLSDASLVKTMLKDATFKNANLENSDFSDAVAPASQWAGANLAGAEFGRAQLAGANFTGCTGSQPGFAGCDLAGADFEGCILRQPDFTAASMPDCIFRNAVLPDAGFYEIVAPNSNFEDAQIPRGRFSDAQVGHSNFKRCLLEEGVMENSRLGRCDFTGARLARVVFTGARAPQALFVQAHCTNAKFDDVVAPRARFIQTNLFRASFENADLTEALFLGSNCYEVEFFQAVVTDAVFDQTNLKGTKRG